MTHLLDVNVLLALCEPQHIHHEPAHRWFKTKEHLSWATCPLTENAFLRITSKKSYPHWQGSCLRQWQLLREFCALPEHIFWADEVSLLRPEIWTDFALVSPAHLTDLYLLALTVKNRGKLVSFDQNIPAHLVRGGEKALILLPS
jgi:toxin-antitoxin system PIN domain toxin